MGVSLRFVFGVWWLGTASCLHGANAIAHFSAAETRILAAEGRNLVDLLQNHHYQRLSLFEIESQAFLRAHLRSLDPDAGIFSASDFQHLKRRFEKTLKGVYLMKGDFTPAFEIYELFLKRLEERNRRALTQLDTVDLENLTLPKEEDAAAEFQDSERLQKRWDRRVLFQYRKYRLLGNSRDASIHLVKQTLEATLEEARSLSAISVRERFIDAILRTFDAHSGYFSADSSADFLISMSGIFKSVGISIEREAGRTKVSHIFPASPADESDSIEVGDELLEMREEGRPPLDVRTALLRDTWRRLEGDAGSSVTLLLRHDGDTTSREVILKRREVLLNSTKADSAIILPRTSGEEKYGYLRWPTFYHNQEEATPVRVSQDVRSLLDLLKKEGVAGLVIDLRDNPGGSLTEALELVGIFAGRVTASTTESSDGHVEALEATSDRIFDGPIVVMTDRSSASASELFAGAMLYHRRAVIVGQKSTFGKGSVQNFIELSRDQNPENRGQTPWGTLRLTFQTFARPNGESIQAKGIASDVVMPPIPDEDEDSETTLPGSLPEKDLRAPLPTRAANGITSEVLQECIQKSASDISEEAHWRITLEMQTIRAELSTDDLSLPLNEAMERHQRQLLRYAALAKEKRTLAAGESYPLESLPLPCVAEQKSREVALAAGRSKDGEPDGFFRHGRFFTKDTKGELIAIEPRQLDWYLAAAEVSQGPENPVKVEEQRLRAAFLNQISGKGPSFERLLRSLRGSEGKDDPSTEIKAKQTLRKVAELQGLLESRRFIQNSVLRQSVDVLKLLSKNHVP